MTKVQMSRVRLETMFAILLWMLIHLFAPLMTSLLCLHDVLLQSPCQSPRARSIPATSLQKGELQIRRSPHQRRAFIGHCPPNVKNLNATL